MGKGGYKLSFVTIKNVSFSYPNGHKAIEDINMTFQQGESVSIIGQNGAGKTTLVKTINGLLKPTAGEIIVDNWNTKDYTTAQMSKKVGYVFQNPDDQIFHNDVYSEIEFGPKNLKLSEEQIKNNVNKSAELTGMTPFLEDNPYDLPFSVRKFVTIASVIAMDTKVVILDEPTAGQDLFGMKQIANIIKELKKQGKTVITITHDMEFTVDNFERVIVMANRKKIADDNVRSIFWDLDILDKAMLKQPHISRLVNSSSLDAKVLKIPELVEKLKNLSVPKVGSTQ